jgi:transcriptional repressor NrdR
MLAYFKVFLKRVVRPMKCPYCGYPESKVIDSRMSKDGSAIRRRRECLECKRRITTYERLEDTPLMVIKNDKRREQFDRNKIRTGIRLSCNKLDISEDQIDETVEQIEKEITQRFEREVPVEEIGLAVMNRLRALNEVAYVRFASVYRQFKDVNDFMFEIQSLPEKS